MLEVMSPIKNASVNFNLLAMDSHFISTEKGVLQILQREGGSVFRLKETEKPATYIR